MLRSRLFAIFLVASLLFEPVALLLVLVVLVELVALFQTSSSCGATLERKDAVEHEDGGCEMLQQVYPASHSTWNLQRSIPSLLFEIFKLQTQRMKKNGCQ
jgi:hypothetical protein